MFLFSHFTIDHIVAIISFCGPSPVMLIKWIDAAVLVSRQLLFYFLCKFVDRSCRNMESKYLHHMDGKLFCEINDMKCVQDVILLQ